MNEESLFVKIDKEDDVIIDMENLQKTYLLGVEGVPALRGVTLKIYRGEFLIVYGKSGGGKTTLLNIIGTIDRPTKGHLTICGKRIGSRTKDSVLANIRLKRMGFVFQTFNLLSSMNAVQNVEMPMVLRGELGPGKRRKRAQALLTKVGMGERLKHKPSMLSGGEQQRVTIARAISNKPDVLLLDEPTGDLDSVNSDIVLDLLHKLHREQRITMVMVTHDAHLKNSADRVLYMRDGKISRIEVVSKEKKDEFYGSLADRMASYRRKMNEQGVGGPKELKFTRGMTEVRKPVDHYKYQTELGQKMGLAMARKFCATRDDRVLNKRVKMVFSGFDHRGEGEVEVDDDNDNEEEEVEGENDDDDDGDDNNNGFKEEVITIVDPKKKKDEDDDEGEEEEEEEEENIDGSSTFVELESDEKKKDLKLDGGESKPKKTVLFKKDVIEI